MKASDGMSARRDIIRAELERWMAEQKDPGIAIDSVEVHTANRNSVKKLQGGKKKHPRQDLIGR